MFNELMEKYKTANRIFLCGGSDDLAQYWPLGEKVFLLKVDAATMINRLSSPTRDNIHGKDKQTQDILIQRIQRYQTKKIAAGAIPIDATRPVGDVVADIIDKSR